MDDLTGFRRDVLFVINGLGSPHGLAIQTDLEAYYEGTVDHSRLYQNLEAFIERNLVEKSPRDERSNEYRLTQNGEQQLEEHRCWVSECLDSCSDLP